VVPMFWRASSWRASSWVLAGVFLAGVFLAGVFLVFFWWLFVTQPSGKVPGGLAKRRADLSPVAGGLCIT
jgi:apolipoprotein N-acyltransferase